jgi:hypothetical protein
VLEGVGFKKSNFKNQIFFEMKKNFPNFFCQQFANISSSGVVESADILLALAFGQASPIDILAE